MGDAAREGVEDPQNPGDPGAVTLRHRLVNRLVQKNREIEDGEPLHQGDRNPDPGLGTADEEPARDPEQEELPDQYEEVPPCPPLVKPFQLVVRDRRLQVALEIEAGLDVEVTLPWIEGHRLREVHTIKDTPL